jgi:uncharacterized protein with HEPN domain
MPKGYDAYLADRLQAIERVGRHLRRAICGLRDILIHEYFGVDSDIIRDIVQEKLPVLRVQVRAIIKARRVIALRGLNLRRSRAR